MISEILGSRPYESLPAPECNLIDRLRSVVVVPASTKYTLECAMFDRAFFDPQTFRIQICNSEGADNQLAGALAHEFEHSIDPCVSTLELYQFNPTALEIAATQVHNNPPHFVETIEIILRNSRRSGLPYTTKFPFAMDAKGQEVFSWLQCQGIMKLKILGTPPNDAAKMYSICRLRLLFL